MKDCVRFHFMFLFKRTSVLDAKRGKTDIYICIASASQLVFLDASYTSEKNLHPSLII